MFLPFLESVNVVYEPSVECNSVFNFSGACNERLRSYEFSNVNCTDIRANEG